MKYGFTWAAATLAVLFTSIPQRVSAHVRYLIDTEAVETYQGLDIPFLFRALADPGNLGLMLWTIAGAIIVFIFATQIKIFREILKNISDRANNYTQFIPWMLRLSLGIALIGSGTAMHLISPALANMPMFATIQVFLGFLIMAGFLVVPAAFAAIVLYGIAVATDWYLIGNLDFFAIALSLIVLDNERPGLDDLLGFPKMSPLHRLRPYVPLILRCGIGLAMMFLAVYEKLLNPHLSGLIVANFNLQNVIPVSPEMWILSTGIIEFVIGLALVLGVYTRTVATIAFAVLSLSFFYFGEEVTSHITLFGILSVLFITQGGKLSVDKKLALTSPDFM
jgi:uncharacterized membrane protein YphA (DoxX/SURF4 family)